MTINEPPQTESSEATVGPVPNQPPAWPPVRHPFQVWTLGVFLTLGAVWLMVGPSETLASTFHGGWVKFWPALLFVSGICGMVSALYAVRDEGLSLLTERVALVGVAGFCLIYTGTLLLSRGVEPYVGELVFGGLLIACVVRYGQVRKRIKWLKKVGRTTSPRWRP